MIPRPRAAAASLASALLALAPTGCGARAPRDEPASARPPPARGAAVESRPEASNAPRAPTEPESEPELVEAPRTEALAVPGFRDAVLVVPPKGARAKPLVVATHGAGGGPEPYCAFYGAVARGRAFVVCPRGRAIAAAIDPTGSRGFYYPNHPALEREIRAAIAAVEAAYPGRVDAARAVYTGFSQGATMGALDLPLLADQFASALLVEGGFDEWGRGPAEKWAAAGPKRTAFACGRPRCTDAAKRSAAHLVRAGVESRVVSDHRVGHAMSGLSGLAHESFEWLVEYDARFAE